MSKWGGVKRGYEVTWMKWGYGVWLTGAPLHMHCCPPHALPVPLRGRDVAREAVREAKKPPAYRGRTWPQPPLQINPKSSAWFRTEPHGPSVLPARCARPRRFKVSSSHGSQSALGLLEVRGTTARRHVNREGGNPTRGSTGHQLPVTCTQIYTWAWGQLESSLQPYTGYSHTHKLSGR